MSESKVAETALAWTESRMGCLVEILIKSGSSGVETEIRKSCLSRVVASNGNVTEIERLFGCTLDEITANDQFSNIGLIADCVSCWRVCLDTISVNCAVLNAIDTRMRSRTLPLSMSEGILIGLIELFTDSEQDQDLFCALYSTNRYQLLTYVRDTSVCISREGSGRLSNALKLFLGHVWNTGSKFGPNRLMQVLILIERYSRIYESKSALVFPDMTYFEPFVLFERFLSELTARLFLLARFETRLDIVSTFTTNNQPLQSQGGIDALRSKFPWLERC